VAAVLSDLVYHTGTEVITAPPGWEKVASSYVAATGYYGEAWGKLALDTDGSPIPGTYTEIIQVNRGTVFTDTGAGAPQNVTDSINSAGGTVPGANLNANPGDPINSNAMADHTSTVSADEQIVTGQKPAYLASADGFYSQIRNMEVNGTQPFLNIPIIEAGQSLGGATSDSVVADNYAPGVQLSAITFNALPYGRGIGGLSADRASQLTPQIKNYYVGNEIFTDSLLSQAALWLFGGTAIGTPLSLPDLPSLPTNTFGFGRLQDIHDAPSGVSQLFQLLYPVGSADRAAALAWLAARYPSADPGNPAFVSPNGIPEQITAVLTGASVPTDQPQQQIALNEDDTVSIITDGDGGLASAQQIETVSQTQAAADDTYQVTSIPANAGYGEAAVWETDVYNGASQLVSVTQSKIYTDGGFAEYSYDPNKVLQSIYVANPANFGGIIAKFTVGDTIDLAGIGTATTGTIGANNVLTVTGATTSPITLKLDPSQDYTGENPVVAPDGNGGTNVTLNCAPTTTVPSSINALAGIATPVTGISVSDPDAISAGETLTVVVSDQLGLLTTSAVPGGTVSGSGTAAVTLRGNLASINTELAGLTYMGSYGIPDIIDVATSDGRGGTDDHQTEVASNYTAVTFKFTFNGYRGHSSLVPIVVYDMNGVPSMVGVGVEFDKTDTVHGYSYYEIVPETGAEFLISGETDTAVPGEPQFNTNVPVPAYRNPTTHALLPITFASSTMAAFFGTDALFSVPASSFLPLDASYSIDGPRNYNGSYYWNQDGATVITSDDELYITDFTVSDVACYSAGTLISTASGEIPVESLVVGDLVQTYNGELRPVIWIGVGKVLATRGRRNAATPVIVRKGALADNVPNRDLHITKAHSLYIDGVLIPVEFLVNHRTILWDDRAQEVTIYHIELETHDVLLANGTPAESYRDDGNRWLFQNANSGWHLPPKPPYAPVLTGGPVVDAAWRRFLDRAGPRGNLPLTDDPNLHLLVDGKRIDAMERRDTTYVFRLAERPRQIRIRSRSAVPQELGVARDARELGVAIRQIVLAQRRWQRTIDAEAASLANGYHAFEPDNGIRWTNGDAAVPEDIFADMNGPGMLMLHLGGATQYLDDGTTIRVAAA
jgi:hypothetical protein